MYACAKCSRPVVLVAGKAIRDCQCPASTPVVARMASALVGKGAVK